MKILSSKEFDGYGMVNDNKISYTIFWIDSIFHIIEKMESLSIPMEYIDERVSSNFYVRYL